MVEVISTKIISLLTTNIKSRKLISVKRDGMVEALKSLNIGVKVLARRTNAMWDILLVSEEKAKSFHWGHSGNKGRKAANVEHGHQKDQITLHRVSMYIKEEHLGIFLMRYRCIEEVSSVKSRAIIATSDFEVM